jgi:hypothetical protein
MCWPEPKWKRYKKHYPPPGVPWKKLVAQTRFDDATYHPDVEKHREQLEMHCVRKGREILNADGSRDHPNIREFWEDCGMIIGASLGIQTSFVFAEWQWYGDLNEVHGRPIAPIELRRRGEPA